MDPLDLNRSKNISAICLPPEDDINVFEGVNCIATGPYKNLNIKMVILMNETNVIQDGDNLNMEVNWTNVSIRQICQWLIISSAERFANVNNIVSISNDI